MKRRKLKENLFEVLFDVIWDNLHVHTKNNHSFYR